jgi:hypothetical protein
VAESNGQDVHWPWFSGLRLHGEVAGQYQMESSGTEQELKDSTRAAMLELDGLAPITIFVGANNSGKSRLMRELFGRSLSGFKLKCRNSEGTEVDIGRMLPAWTEAYGVVTFDETMYSTVSWIYGELVTNKISEWLKQQNAKIALNGSEDLEGKTKYLALKELALGYGIKAVIRGFNGAKRCYVPILRGMRPPFFQYKKGEDNERYKDLYKKRSASDYFSKGWYMFGKERNLIFTGLSLYDDLLGRLLGRTQAERDSVRVYENFFSENVFPGQSVILIPVMEGNNDVVHIKIGNNDERPIYDLGDGMQSLIICTYPIVTETEKCSLFFLEEPDLCMHPSLQRTFLEVLKTYHLKMGHQFFITTHSNHLLDLLEDNELVSIFSFSEIADRAPGHADQSKAESGSNPQQSKPKPSFRIRPSNLRDRQTLLELGVRPSATFLANATIWVEGVSDSAYLRAYMEAFVHYLKHLGNGWGKALAERLEQYKEDRHYAFVEYSGANLTHFSFEESERDNDQTVTSVPDLSGKAIVIADGDIAAKVNREAHFVAQLKERFICLPCKEIENLIPEELMKRQIRLDHTPPQRGDVEEDAIKNLNYALYARSEEGIGKHLGKLGIEKYSGTTGNGGGSGTLPTTYKSRWRSVEKGIPALIRVQVDVAENLLDSADIIQSDDLPEFLTNDLIWLCILVYTHIAGCNYDNNAEVLLKELQGHIATQAIIPERDLVSHEVPNLASSNDTSSMAEPIDQPETIPNLWPISVETASSRASLLNNFSPSVVQS